MNNAVCWVIQEGKNDYSAAEQFGEVNFITKDDLRSLEGEQNLRVYQDIRQFLAKYIPGEDYIVPSGNPVLLGLVMMAIAAKFNNGHRGHKVLKWDGRRSAYIPHTISTGNII